MYERIRRAALIGSIVIVATACGGALPTISSPPAATSYEEYATAACAAWDSLFRAVGNPDTGSGSELSKSLDAAVAAGDAASAGRIAETITTELETGRQHAAVAGGWQPAAATMEQLDKVFFAFEMMTAAKKAVAQNAPGASEPQAAFEAAGGADAWFAMFAASSAMARPSASVPKQCPNVPVVP